MSVRLIIPCLLATALTFMGGPVRAVDERAAIAFAFPASQACGLNPQAGGVLASAGPPGRVVLEDGRVIRLSDFLFSGGSERWQSVLTPYLGRRITLMSAGEKPGLIGPHAHIFVLQAPDQPPIWLQRALLSEGQGVFYVYPGKSSCSKPLLEEESRARAAGVGRWADFLALTGVEVTGPQPIPSKILVAEATDPVLPIATGRYGIIHGHVLSIGAQGSWTYLNFGVDFHKDFTIRLTKTAEKALLKHGFTTKDLIDTEIEVRGILQNSGGALIDVFDMAQLTLLDRSQRPGNPSH